MKSKAKKTAVLLAAAMIPTAIFTGCSGNNEEEGSGGPYLVVSSSLVNEEKAKELVSTLNESLPGVEIQLNAISVGDTSKDPTSAMAGIMKLTMVMAGQEADVLIADYDSAWRNAGSEAFYPLTELFSEEELNPYLDKIVSFELTDDQGNPTGEKVENCGIDVSDNAELTAICPGADSVGVYIISNSPNLDTAKEIFRLLAFTE